MTRTGPATEPTAAIESAAVVDTTTSGPGEVRDRAGAERDQVARERDRVGALRDAAAEARDRAAERSEARWFRILNGARRSTIARREAAADRDAGASERTGAGLDRANADADRRDSARDRQDASVDSLTGVSRRGAGFLALDREIARAKRAGQTLTVGFIDVDHLKAVNDGQGHTVGDQMLLEVANALRASLRASDLIFRYGGDEFVCALSGVDAAFGDSRISLVNSALGIAAVPASVTAGFAELRPGESSDDLVARADEALYRARDAPDRVAENGRETVLSNPERHVLGTGLPKTAPRPF